VVVAELEEAARIAVGEPPRPDQQRVLDTAQVLAQKRHQQTDFTLQSEAILKGSALTQEEVEWLRKWEEQAAAIGVRTRELRRLLAAEEAKYVPWNVRFRRSLCYFAWQRCIEWNPKV